MNERSEETQIDAVLQEVRKEIVKAKANYSDYANAHEGYAVLLEEVDELWDNVKLSQKKHPERDAKIYMEAKQVAAVAVRIMIDCFLNNVDKEVDIDIVSKKVCFCDKCGAGFPEQAENGVHLNCKGHIIRVREE